MMEEGIPPHSKGSASDPIVIEDASSTPPKTRQEAHEESSPCTKRPRMSSPKRVAPIKIFRTKQVEASSHVDPVVRENTTTLRELLLCSERSVQWIIISNFLIDFQLLLEEVPELVSANLLLCFYGSDINPGSIIQWNRVCMREGGSSRFHAVCLNPSDPANSKNNPLPSKIPYGVHHSKFFLVGYSDNSLRVVVHTANLVYTDLHLKADAAFLQDFPKKRNMTTTATAFENDLVHYIESYRYRKCHAWDSDDSDSLSLTQLLRQYDFSSAQAVLIPSIPGYHRGTDIHLLGHMKLRHSVREHCRREIVSSRAVVCQFSSMGSLNEKWLQHEFGASGAPHIPKPLTLLIFPTAKEVCESVEGYAGGRSLPSNTKNMQKGFLRPLYRKWSATDSHNPFSSPCNLPHIKTFFRYGEANECMDWFVLSSHNISSAAWGQLQKNGQQFFVRHWELGVFLSPRTLGCNRLVPLLDAASAPDDIAIPLPYKFKPDAYQPSDEPWAWDKTYQNPDSFGCHGL